MNIPHLFRKRTLNLSRAHCRMASSSTTVDLEYGVFVVHPLVLRSIENTRALITWFRQLPVPVYFQNQAHSFRNLLSITSVWRYISNDHTHCFLCICLCIPPTRAPPPLFLLSL